MLFVLRQKVTFIIQPKDSFIKNEDAMKRKEFLRNSFIAATGLTILPACKNEVNPVEPVLQSEAPPFPYLEVSDSSSYNIGYKIGSHFQFQFNELFTRLTAQKINNPESPFNGMSVIEVLLHFVNTDPAVYYDPFYNAVQTHFPDYLDELKGMADGSGVPFQNIFTSMCQLEIISLLSSSSAISTISLKPFIKGCSTLSYASKDKLYLAHNEDFFSAHADLMYVVKVSQPGKPTFLSLNYPGSVLGIPPGMNDAGMVFSGNQVDITHAAAGVPFVFLSRAILAAKNIEEAKSIVQISNLAFSTHLNIGSFKEKKIISAEVMPGKYEVHEVENFYAHTNHFVLPTMAGLSVEDENSLQRRSTLISKSSNYKNKPSEVNSDLITGWMSSHDGYPNAVCVHLDGGLTVAHSMFDFQNETWKLYRGNPCNNAYKTIKLL